MSDIAKEKYKSLLIVNESSDAWVTLYLYPTWDFICWLSFESKIIRPNGGKYLHRSSTGFKFKLVARFRDGRRSQQTLKELEEWNKDKLLKITNSLDLTEGRLEDFPEEKIVCLRKAQRDKELNTNGKRNLYTILGLDMSQVRKMPKKDQIKAIKKGFQKEIQRWHPDKNFGDDEIAKEIIIAYKILMDEEKRTRYHNEADYDNGWLSLKRWKAIFCPECVTEEQKEAYRHRMFMFALSFGIAAIGLAAPAALATGAVLKGGLIGAGLQSLQHTMSRKSVVDECDKKQWLVGFLTGAATGSAAVAIKAGVAGLGVTAAEPSALTMGKFVGIEAGSSAVGGVVQSLATDAGRKLADGEDVTWKQVLGHAALGAAVGAAAGAAGGAVTKSVVGIEASAASANIEGEIGEQVAILTGARRLGKFLVQTRIPRTLTENGTEAVMSSVAQFTEERLDDSVENRNPGKHLVEGVQNVAVSTVKGLAQETGGAIASHVRNEFKVKMRLKKERSQQLSTPLIDDDTSVVGPRVDCENEQITCGRVRGELPEENNEHRINWRGHSKYSFSY